MRFYSLSLLIASVLFVGSNSLAQSVGSRSDMVTDKDLQAVLGEWEGSLTYIDYGSGEPFTMFADLVVTKGKNETILVLQHIFPDEPKANATDRIRVSRDGRKLNRNVVILRKVLPDGTLEITTANSGKDNRKKVKIRRVYCIAENEFSIVKEVKFEGAESWLKRSEFKYKKSSTKNS